MYLTDQERDYKIFIMHRSEIKRSIYENIKPVKNDKNRCGNHTTGFIVD